MPKKSPGPRGESWEHALDQEQVERLIRACQDLEERVCVKTPIFMGLRAGEIAHMNARWVHGDELWVPASMKCGCADCAPGGVWTPKTRAGARKLYIPPFLGADLFEYLRLKPRGIQRSRIAVWAIVKRVAKRARIEELVYTHSLRATCASILATRMNATQLAYYMGWSSLEMAEHYVRIAQSQSAAKDVARSMWG